MSEQSVAEMCTEPTRYGQPISPTETYTQELNRWIECIVKHTGLQMHIEEHVPLILMYTLMAMHKGKEVTQEDIHDAWALWTRYIRKIPGHPNMVFYGQLSERDKALDKIDMWAIQETAKECSQ